MSDNFKPKIVAFYCSNCASSAANVAEGMNKALPDNVKMVQVPCTGRLELLHLLSHLRKAQTAYTLQAARKIAASTCPASPRQPKG